MAVVAHLALPSKPAHRLGWEVRLCAAWRRVFQTTTGPRNDSGCTALVDNTHDARRGSSERPEFWKSPLVLVSHHRFFSVLFGCPFCSLSFPASLLFSSLFFASFVSLLFMTSTPATYHMIPAEPEPGKGWSFGWLEAFLIGDICRGHIYCSASVKTQRETGHW